MSKHEIIERVLCGAEEIPNNSMKDIEIKLDETSTAKVLLIKSDNQLSCLSALCSHYSVPLSLGVLYKGRLRCMAHGACFDVKTGDIEDYPGINCLPKFNIFLREGFVYIKATREELETKQRIKDYRNEVVEKQMIIRKSADLIMDSKTIVTDRSGRPVSVDKKQVKPINSAQDLLAKIEIETSAKIKEPEMMPKCLIIGSGAAGLLCMDTLRENGFCQGGSGNITVLTEDSQLPYDRPKLSKKLDSSIDSILLRDDEYFKQYKINYRINQEVKNVNFDEKKVTCSSGEVYDYQKLVIATGFKPLDIPQTPGRNLKGIFTLRSFANANSITTYYNVVKELDTKSKDRELNVVLVGGSFISMELVSFFIDKKARVLVMARNKPFEKAFGDKASSKIIQLHENKGAKFLIDKKFGIKEFTDSNKSGALSEIELINGNKYPCDICILAIGGKPCTDFLKSSKLEMTPAGLIKVNKNMMTNLEDVYAVGDITYFPRSCLPGIESKNQSEIINISHWGLASSQGRSAALSIVNQTRSEKLKSELNVVPFFWSTQLGKNIRFSGFNDHYDSIIFHENKANSLKFAAFYLLENKVIGVCTLDWDPVCALFAEALYNKIDVRKEHVTGDPFDLRNLLTS